jgi:hypothetical protein
MATLTELQYTSDWLKGEVESPNKFTRDQITVSNPGGAAVTYPGGLVLAKSGSNYIIVAPAASDGTQNAVAILGATVTIAAGGTVNTWGVTRGPAILSDVNVSYPAGATTNQKAAAVTQLGALGIIVRRSA